MNREIKKYIKEALKINGFVVKKIISIKPKDSSKFDVNFIGKDDNSYVAELEFSENKE